MGLLRSTSLSYLILLHIFIKKLVEDRTYPISLLSEVYEGYIQLRLYYDITLYGNIKKENIDLVQWVQNHAQGRNLTISIVARLTLLTV